MPTFFELSNTAKRAEFAKKVAKDIDTSSDKFIDVNKGIKTTSDLQKLIRDGRNVTFDYDRLIQESKTY